MAELAILSLMALMLAGSAVALSRTFMRGTTRRVEDAALEADQCEWALPYKLEASVPTPPARLALRLVSPRAAALRALCLAAYLQRAQWEIAQEPAPDAEGSPGESLPLGMPPAPDPTALNAWLRAEGLWPMLAEIERRGLEAPAGQWDDSLRLYAEGAREALAMLAWAGHFSEDLLPFDVPADAAALCSVVGLMLPTAALLPDLSLRPECELAAARELCQAWVWRARVALDSAAGAGPTDVIRAAARYWSAAGAFTMLGDDFPVDGHPIAQLDASACRRVHRTAQLRLQGLNWVCGVTHAWDHASGRRLSM